MWVEENTYVLVHVEKILCGTFFIISVWVSVHICSQACIAMYIDARERHTCKM